MADARDAPPSDVRKAEPHYLSPDPAAGVRGPAARALVKRARFNLSLYGRTVGTPPPDAPDLNYKIGVEEPEAWVQSSSDEDRTRRVAATLKRAGIRARVGSVDVG